MGISSGAVCLFLIFILNNGGRNVIAGATATSGPLFDHVSRESLVIGASIIIAGVCQIAIPFVRSIVVIIVLALLQGLGMGAMDSGGSVCCLRLHGERAAPWMQAMHFAFSVGSAAAPPVVGAIIDRNGDIRASFVVLGVAAVALGVVSLFPPSFKKGACDTSIISSQTLARRRAVPRRWYWGLIGMGFLFLLTYASAEISYSNFLTAYSIAIGTDDEVSGSYLTTRLPPLAQTHPDDSAQSSGPRTASDASSGSRSRAS